jgi:hypothetical protein
MEILRRARVDFHIIDKPDTRTFSAPCDKGVKLIRKSFSLNIDASV